jgi:hypothetical protein
MSLYFVSTQEKIQFFLTLSRESKLQKEALKNIIKV